MSGHSKWAKIHRAKGAADAERGKIFQKLAKEIYVAAKGTDGNIDMNPGLRAVVEKAKSQNMPKDNIAKAIDKATKSVGGEDYEEVRYEGYGHGGVALMIDCLTDNRNRTAMLVRSTMTKKGGNLGTDGSVSYLFERKGIIVINKDIDEDTAMMTSLENGALDFIVNDENYEIYTTTDTLIKVKEGLEQSGVKEFLTSEITYVAKNQIELDEEGTEKVLSLVEMLEDIDDVQNVYYNLSE